MGSSQAERRSRFRAGAAQLAERDAKVERMSHTKKRRRTRTPAEPATEEALLERSLRAVALCYARRTIRSIAADLGVSVGTNHADLVQASDRIRRARKRGNLTPAYLRRLGDVLAQVEDCDAALLARACAEDQALEARMRKANAEDDAKLVAHEEELELEFLRLSAAEAEAMAPLLDRIASLHRTPRAKSRAKR